MIYSLCILKKLPQNEDNLNNEDDLKNEDDFKNEDYLNIENNPNNEDYLKNKEELFWPPLTYKNYLTFFLLTSHLYARTATDIKTEMLSGVKPGNGIPHDKNIIRSIIHALRYRL